MERAFSGRVFCFHGMFSENGAIPPPKHKEQTMTDPKQTSETPRKYASFELSFMDKWENAEVELSFRFAKPTKMEIKRLQDTAGKNAGQAARNLLLSTVHPDDREKLTQAMEDYPGIVTSYSTALIKAVGISADLGN